jgi:hypothetical protein
MNTEKIKKLISNGFRPFAIRLSDGRKFNVPHPEFVAVGRNVVVVIDSHDVSHTIDALHIVSVEEKRSHK